LKSNSWYKHYIFFPFCKLQIVTIIKQLYSLFVQSYEKSLFILKSLANIVARLKMRKWRWEEFFCVTVMTHVVQIKQYNCQ